MALKIRFHLPTGKHPWATLLMRVGVIGVAAVALACISVFGYFYIKYQHVVDDRLKQPIFANTAKIYAAPREVRPGQKLTIHLIANELHEAGYTAEGAAPASPLGSYAEGGQTIAVPMKSNQNPIWKNDIYMIRKLYPLLLRVLCI